MFPEIYTMLSNRRRKRTKELQNSQKIINKMAIVSPYLSIITLSVKVLNSPIKRHRKINWIKKQDSTICCLQKNHFSFKDTHRLKVKKWKKTFHANETKRKLK